MTTKSNAEKEAQKRLAEIGRILCDGIKRLKDREESKNSLNQLDYEAKGSVHRANNNMNH